MQQKKYKNKQKLIKIPSPKKKRKISRIFSIQKWNIFEHFRIEKNRDRRIVIFRIIFDQFWLNATKLIGNIISKNGRKKCIFTFFDRKS